jgi:hypothetical protein
MESPVEWPDGTELVVSPITLGGAACHLANEAPESSEDISDWLKWYESLEPLILSDEERAAWEKTRKEQRELEKAAFASHGDRLQGLWK